jgi:hypothetical protein
MYLRRYIVPCFSILVTQLGVLDNIKTDPTCSNRAFNKIRPNVTVFKTIAAKMIDSRYGAQFEVHVHHQKSGTARARGGRVGAKCFSGAAMRQQRRRSCPGSGHRAWCKDCRRQAEADPAGQADATTPPQLRIGAKGIAVCRTGVATSIFRSHRSPPMNSRMLDSPYDELPITAAPHAGGGMITIRNAIAASFILIVALASQAHAGQSNAQKFFRAFGVGRDNCGEFIQAAENSPSATRNPDPKYGEFIGFIAGFLTGADWGSQQITQEIWGTTTTLSMQYCGLKTIAGRIRSPPTPRQSSL